MNIPTVLAGLPSTFIAIFAIAFLTAGGLIFYALRSKGDVRAEFSHGSTKFRLEAKDKVRKKDQKFLVG